MSKKRKNKNKIFMLRPTKIPISKIIHQISFYETNYFCTLLHYIALGESLIWWSVWAVYCKRFKNLVQNSARMETKVPNLNTKKSPLLAPVLAIGLKKLSSKSF